MSGVAQYAAIGSAIAGVISESGATAGRAPVYDTTDGKFLPRHLLTSGSPEKRMAPLVRNNTRRSSCSIPT